MIEGQYSTHYVLHPMFITYINILIKSNNGDRSGSGNSLDKQVGHAHLTIVPNWVMLQMCCKYFIMSHVS